MMTVAVHDLFTYRKPLLSSGHKMSSVVCVCLCMYEIPWFKKYWQMRGEGTCVYLWSVHVDVWQIPSQCCKAVKVKVESESPTLCDYTVHGILQARILEWVAFLFSRGSSQPRDRTEVSSIAGRFIAAEPKGYPPIKINTFF